MFALAVVLPLYEGSNRKPGLSLRRIAQVPPGLRYSMSTLRVFANIFSLPFCVITAAGVPAANTASSSGDEIRSARNSRRVPSVLEHARAAAGPAAAQARARIETPRSHRGRWRGPSTSSRGRWSARAKAPSTRSVGRRIEDEVAFPDDAGEQVCPVVDEPPALRVPTPFVPSTERAPSFPCRLSQPGGSDWSQAPVEWTPPKRMCPPPRSLRMALQVRPCAPARASPRPPRT